MNQRTKFIHFYREWQAERITKVIASLSEQGRLVKHDFGWHGDNFAKGLYTVAITYIRRNAA